MRTSPRAMSPRSGAGGRYRRKPRAEARGSAKNSGMGRKATGGAAGARSRRNRCVGANGEVSRRPAGHFRRSLRGARGGAPSAAAREALGSFCDWEREAPRKPSGTPSRRWRNELLRAKATCEAGYGRHPRSRFRCRTSAFRCSLLHIREQRDSGRIGRPSAFVASGVASRRACPPWPRRAPGRLWEQGAVAASRMDAAASPPSPSSKPQSPRVLAMMPRWISEVPP